MKTLNLLTAIFLVILVTAIPSFAKDIDIVGKITTMGKYPLNNVSVFVKGEQKNISSDNEGNFRITCDKKDKLVFRANGFSTKRIPVAGIDSETPIQVNLKLKDGEKNYELATVYGHISEETLSRDILLINPRLDYGQYTSMYEILDQEPNLNGGRLGFKPLYVVDGFEVNSSYFMNLSTNDIESIAVLRNTAAARYGAKGYSGVIEVVTKSK